MDHVFLKATHRCAQEVGMTAINCVEVNTVELADALMCVEYPCTHILGPELEHSHSWRKMDMRAAWFLVRTITDRRRVPRAWPCMPVVFSLLFLSARAGHAQFALLTRSAGAASHPPVVPPGVQHACSLLPWC